MSGEDKKSNNKQVRSTGEGVTTLNGIELSDGTLVLPGLSNSFQIYKNIPWHRRHKALWTGILAVVIGITVMVVDFEWNEYSDEYLDSISVTVDFGDIVQPFKKKTAGKRIVEVDEVFGNQYVKDKEDVVDTDSDDYITGVINSAAQYRPGAATAPVPLGSPQPPYPKEAQAAGVEGTVILELVIDKTGKVLRARPAKKVHPALDRAASRHYKNMKFKPSMGKDGPIVVKFYQPVRFVLE